MDLSIYILTLDCNDTIQTALNYAKTICTDIVVLDGGSADNTLDLVRQNKRVRVYERPMPLSFAEQRNFAIQKCKNKWILQLDADEIYRPGILDVLNKVDRVKCDSLIVPTFHLKDDIEHYSPCVYPDFHTRLFKSDLRYSGDIHERLEGKAPYLTKAVHLIHFGHIRNKDNQVKKFKSREKFKQLDPIDGKMADDTYFHDRNTSFDKRELGDLYVRWIKKFAKISNNIV